jgi:hypothetical protein
MEPIIRFVAWGVRIARCRYLMLPMDSAAGMCVALAILALSESSPSEIATEDGQREREMSER